MITITANIPERKKMIKGKIWTTRAKVEVFTQDDAGRWSLADEDFGKVSLLQDEVIDVCKKATNWPTIKQAHFPMVGFHN